jgi:hypothetical protein
MRWGDEEGPTKASAGEHVAICAGDSLDDALEAEPAEIVRHAGRSVLRTVRIEQISHILAELSVRETVRQMGERAQRRQESHDPRLTESKGRRALAVEGRRQDYLPEAVRRQSARVTDSLDAKEASVNVVAEGLEVAQIPQEAADLEISRVVDGGFGAQGAILFEVLLYVRMLESYVEAGTYGIGYDTGAVSVARSRSAPVDALVEEELNAIGTTDVEILTDSLFEELAAVQRSVKHVGNAKLDLTNAELVLVPSALVFERERPRQTTNPPAEERFDVVGTEAIADALECIGVGTGQEAVIERLIGYAALFKALFGPFVTVQADLHAEGGIGADLDERRAEITIDEVEIVVGHEYFPAGVFPRLVAVVPCLSAVETPGLFLGGADQIDAFRFLEFLPVACGDVVLSFAPLELDNGDVVVLGELLHA